ncbi:MAG: methyltransferase domain-containing protein [Bacteroidota bacterium]|nr:methyltransferase domain-containing protein [Bacteroidota bacterium]
MENAEWFKDWFNSPYYHLLYNNRSETEADFFISNICNFLNLNKGAKLWDLACGKGRHSLALNKKGYVVTGTDLSRQNIFEASQNCNPTLDFYIHDMRTPFRVNYFDAVFNLFTSIGYFKNFKDNFLVLKNVDHALKSNGYFVVDFFNANKVRKTIKPTYIEKRGDILFNIHKQIINNEIHKRIGFNDKGKSYFFEETVSLLTKSDFESFANSCNLKLVNTFGSYNLDDFDNETSDRLILIFKK